MKSTVKSLLIAIIFIMALHGVAAVPFVFTGYVQGDCFAQASVNITVYAEGTNTIVATTSVTAGSDGAYGWSAGTAQNTNYDITITATHTACSPGAVGTVTLTSVDSGGLSPVPITQNVTIAAPFSLATPSNGSTTNDNTTTFTWTTDYPSTTYNLQVASDQAFSTIVHNITGIAGSSYTLTAGQTLNDGTYYWRVLAYNASSDLIDTAGWQRVTIVSSGATITGSDPATGSWTGNTSQPVSITTDSAAVCKWSLTNNTAWASKTTFATTGGTTHQSTVTLNQEGANNLFVQCNSTTGVLDASDTVIEINRDTTPPSAVNATLLIDSGADYSTDTTLSLAWSGFADTGSGITTYYFGTVNNEGTTNGTADTASPGQISGIGQGSVTIYVWAKDAAGNIGLATSDSIIVDSLPPSFLSWTLDPSDLTKYSTGGFTITTDISDASPLATLPQVRYRIGSDAWSVWQSMQLISNVGTTGTYTFTIPESASPNTWFERNGDTLYYQVSAADINGEGNTVERSEYINDQSTPPSFVHLGSKAYYEGENFSFIIQAQDFDHNSLTITCDMNRSSVVMINDTAARFSFNATSADIGSHIVPCNVTDGIFVVSDEFNLTILNINDPPVLGPIGDLYAYEYAFFNYSINATDPDNDLLIYDTNATIFSINRVTGKIGFTPTNSQRGTHKINVTVEDGKGGSDYEAISFTIGYCGDNVCDEDHESCSICSKDCGVCDTAQKDALLIDQRNCLGQQMTIKAVSLVPRATCEQKGVIINGMEACGNNSDTTLNMYLHVDNETWEDITDLVTDEKGIATFTPSEVGKYKIVYASNRDVETFFSVDACLAKEQDDQSSSKPSTTPSTNEPTTPPVIEEPTTTAVGGAKWSFLSVLLYFIALPMLAVAMLISVVGYAYQQERRNHKESGFTKQVEQALKQYAQAKSWLRRTTPFKEIIVGSKQASAVVSKQWGFVAGVAQTYWYDALLALGFKREIKLAVYDLHIEGKRMHLLLLSLLKAYFPKRNVDELLGLTYQYSIANLLDLAAMLMSFGLRVTYIDKRPTNIPYVNALIGKGLLFRSKGASRVDVESSIQQGNPVVCLINELGARNTVVQSMVVVYGFDKQFVYYHDMLRGRQRLQATKDQFMKSWQAAGEQGLLLRK